MQCFRSYFTPLAVAGLPDRATPVTKPPPTTLPLSLPAGPAANNQPMKTATLLLPIPIPYEPDYHVYTALSFAKI